METHENLKALLRSVRNINQFEKDLEKGIENYVFPEECARNGEVIRQLLGYVPRAFPGFSAFDETEIQNIANVASYSAASISLTPLYFLILLLMERKQQ